MFLQAQTWRVRPSQLLDVQDSYAAFCIDSAIWELGTHIEGELDKVKGRSERSVQAGREAKLKALLSDKPETKQFADPMAMLGGKTADKTDGKTERK